MTNSFSYPSMPEQTAAVVYPSATTPTVGTQPSGYYSQFGVPPSLSWLPTKTWERLKSDPRGEEGYSKEYAASCHHAVLCNKVSLWTAGRILNAYLRH